ncbi:unnamed protein product [Lymnaea stagnalis]|uniref:G-protein coupled receptors family 1 profile domain-containing protein n=1 Tax=Lymnaea stagnalis TaxID=6523 RepID=A0AAV2IB09_LYMST
MATPINDSSTDVDTTQTPATDPLTTVMATDPLTTVMATIPSSVLASIVTALTSLTPHSSISAFFNASSSSASSGDQPTPVTFASVVTSRDSDNVTGVLTSTTYNYSEFEIQAYLDELQSQTTNIMLPAMVYLVLLAVVGSIGNFLVLFVYSHKFTQTATRIFILVIASFDIITNMIVIPGEIYDMFHIWDFNQPSLCKIRLFFNAFTTMASAMVLVAVAVARYRKICKPFGKQVTISDAKLISVAMTLGCLIFSIPWAIINGRQTKATPRPGINGYECTLDDSYLDTIWPLLNTLFFILLFLVCCGTIVVLYALIGVQAWRHSHVHGVSTGVKPPHSSSGTNDSTDSTEMTSKSAENSRVGILSKSARSRSYVKKKSGDPESMETVIKSGVACGEGDQVKPRGEAVKDTTAEDDVIELVDDVKGEKKSAYQARMIRSPTGEKVNINLSMVRELTVKLRAVQKETEHGDVGDLSDVDQVPRPGRSVVTFKSVSSDDELGSGDEYDDAENKTGKKKKSQMKCKPETRDVGGSQPMKCKSETRDVGGSQLHKRSEEPSGGKCTINNGSNDSIDAASSKGGKCKSNSGSTDSIDAAGSKGGKCKSNSGSTDSIDAAGSKGRKCKSNSGSTDSIDAAGSKGGKCKSKNGSTECIGADDSKGGKCKSKNGSTECIGADDSKGGKCKSKNGSTECIGADDSKGGKCKSKNGSTDSIHKNCSKALKHQSSHCPNDTVSVIDHTKELSEGAIKENGAICHLDAESKDELDDEHLNDEPLTDFAKAMLWVDITYCLKNERDGASSNDEPDAENNGGGSNGLTKKSSFTSSRKISRDNSFLRKHRKLRDALTDTLARARKSKREKSGEAKARDSGGVVGANERISENENGDDAGSVVGKDHGDVAPQAEVKQPGSSSSGEKHRSSVKRPSRASSRRGMGRTTAMLLIISAVYIVGFLPFLALSFYKHYAPQSFGGLSAVGLAFYNLFLRSYFLNSAANPIVYSLCDINFRKECLKLLKLG